MGAITYNEEFFADRAAEVQLAKIIVSPLVESLKPSSVVDLGTAAGSWLAAVKQLGVQHVRGIDGPWVPEDQRHIANDEFVPADLEKEIPEIGRFDLAICTEVLEHISKLASVRAVEWLCRAAPVVLFSAAVPLQGGTSHINEAWQSHWSRLFKSQGFETYDVIRPAIWNDKRLPYWYRQNLLLMARGDVGRALGMTPSDGRMLDSIHPDLYLHRAERMNRLDDRSLNGRVRRLRHLAARVIGR